MSSSNSNSNSNSYSYSQMVVSTRTSFTFSAVQTREMVETYPRREFSRPSNENFPRMPYNSFHGGVNGGIPNITSSIITYESSYQLFIENNSYCSPSSQWFSFGPPNHGGGGSSSRSMVEPWFHAAPITRANNMGPTMLPPLTPNHFLTENTRYNSHPSPNGNHINIFRGPSEFTGGSKNNIRNVQSSSYGGVNRGTTNMHAHKRPRYNPLDENIASSSSHPPPQTTNGVTDVFAVQENDSGASDQENIMSIDKEAEAKSWGRDLTLFH